MRIVRGDIYWVFLDPVFGRECGGFKERPVVVMSSARVHDEAWAPIIVVPGTSNLRYAGKNTVVVRKTAKNGLAVDTAFQGHQVRAIDRGRLMHRAGSVDSVDLKRLEAALLYSLGLDRP